MLSQVPVIAPGRNTGELQRSVRLAARHADVGQLVPAPGAHQLLVGRGSGRQLAGPERFGATPCPESVQVPDGLRDGHHALIEGIGQADRKHLPSFARACRHRVTETRDGTSGLGVTGEADQLERGGGASAVQQRRLGTEVSTHTKEKQPAPRSALPYP